MTRIQSLASRPKRTLGALAVVLAAVGITVGSGANFTAQQANAGNAFATGSLTINDPANPSTGAVLSLTDMVPGDSTKGQIVLQNTGTLPGAFSLTQSFPTGMTQDAVLKGALQLKIVHCATAVTTDPCTPALGTEDIVFDDAMSVAGNGTAALPLTGAGQAGVWNANEKNRYEFKVTLPATDPANPDSSNSLQGLAVNATYTWKAVSRNGAPR